MLDHFSCSAVASNSPFWHTGSQSGCRSVAPGSVGTTHSPNRSSPPSNANCSTWSPGPAGPPPARRSSSSSKDPIAQLSMRRGRGRRGVMSVSGGLSRGLATLHQLRRMPAAYGPTREGLDSAATLAGLYRVTQISAFAHPCSAAADSPAARFPPGQVRLAVSGSRRARIRPGTTPRRLEATPALADHRRIASADRGVRGLRRTRPRDRWRNARTSGPACRGSPARRRTARPPRPRRSG